MRAVLRTVSIATFVLATSPTFAKNADWPNAPGLEPRLELPDDPSYAHVDGTGKVTGGQWNLWSFVPESWADNPKFRQEEVSIGTGIHADRAWQRTTGDRRVMVAVLDSGIKWDERNLQMKHYLNKAELTNCKPDKPDGAADDYDVNGDGIFNIGDYLAKDPGFEAARDTLGNKNGILDPGDLIRTCSDAKDDDGNGFTDDISGWDSYRGDNDPYDDTRYGHGTGEANDSVGGGNDGIGGIGVCPECTLLNVRTGDSFVVDVNDFATSVIFSVDSGASVIQEALGSVNNTAYAVQAIEYAHKNNVVIIASAADELSFHHNFPGTNNHTVYVHAVVHDHADAEKSTTFLNFNNCTNFGGQLLLSTPGGGCSSEATGKSSGHAGLMYAAALKANLNPPISAEEIRGTMIMSVDDIDVPESASDITKFPSAKGWDLHFGYGRNNARRSVDMILDGEIPPEVDITQPLWFEPINVQQRKTIDIMGRVGARIDGLGPRYDNYTWTLEWALGVHPQDGWETISTGTSATGGVDSAVLATWDVAKAATRIDFGKTLEDPHQWSVTLRLRVETTKGAKTLKSEFRKTAHFISDPDLHEGWPKYVGTSAEGSPKILDIDGDGGEEIVAATTDGRVHAWKADGATEPPGWPIVLPLRREQDPNYAFYIGKACAFQTDDKKGDDCRGTASVEADVAKETLMLGIAIGALTGGDDLSVVLATFDGSLFVYDLKGQLRPGWPQTSDPSFYKDTDPDHLKDEGFFGAPVLYDLDGDKDLEIIAAGMDAMVYVWHHDGKPMDGWPVLIHDQLEDQIGHIIITPGVGDVDNDGLPEIVVGTNEVYGNEGRAYLLKATGASAPDKLEEALEDGWPVTLNGVAVDVLPLVGKGCPSNPALADLDGDGNLEMNIDTIGYYPTFWKYNGEKLLRTNQDGILAEVNNADFGKYANSEDSPAFVLINSGTFADLDHKGGLDFFKGSAGFDFALAFAEGGKRAIFDHQVSGWDTETFEYLPGFPRKIEDWQFFMNPTAVDIDADGQANLLNGSAGYFVHAWNWKGDEPKGWPKNTGGWIIGSPSAGDFDGDGKWDVFSSTRNGWIFAWKAGGAVSKKGIEWQTYGHDFHNTNNYEEPVAQYNKYPDEPASDGSDAPDGADSEDGSDGVDATDATDATEGTDGTDGTDNGADSTEGTDGAAGGDTGPAAAPSDSGCSSTGAASVGFGLWLILAAFALLVRRGRPTPF